jgi:hypothetical protein
VRFHGIVVDSWPDEHLLEITFGDSSRSPRWFTLVERANGRYGGWFQL